MASEVVVTCDHCKTNILSKKPWRIDVGQSMGPGMATSHSMRYEFCGKCYRGFRHAMKNWQHA